MKSRRLQIALIITACLLVVLFFFWLLYYRFIETTDDAYVSGNQVVIHSQIDGFVQAVYCQDTEMVKEGDLLVVLDPTDPTIALEKAKEQLAEQVRNYCGLQQTAASLEAEKQVQIAGFIKTGQDYLHRQKLIETGAISIEDFEHAEAAIAAAFASLLLAEHRLQAVKAQIDGTTVETYPLVVKAKEEVRQAFVNLKRCRIFSPVSGMVARKAVQVGESIESDDSLLVIVPFDQMWIDANFKEIQLKNVKPGLPVKMRADLYGRGKIFHGRVLGTNAGTGSVFSVLPPQNATGNWIKIVQRLAVRIALDPDEVEAYPLRLGLSMHVQIDVRDTVEEIVNEGKFTTKVFADQLEGADELIKQIVSDNTFAPSILNFQKLWPQINQSP
jgi:membrane fusion protein (multidrug efflux system)